MNHLMIDLETMGTSSFAAIISIAAVQFDLSTGEVGEIFYKNVDLQSCIDVGLKIEPQTVEWWMDKSESARTLYLNSEKQELAAVLVSLSEFIKAVFPNGPEIWGNAARFDLGLLINAYTVCRLQIPWNIKNEWCVRTLAKIIPEIKANHSYTGVAHNPTHDCLNQIEYCTKIWKTINNV